MRIMTRQRKTRRTSDPIKRQRRRDTAQAKQRSRDRADKENR